MVKYTVTRGGVLLGRVHVLFRPGPGVVAGLLHLVPGASRAAEVTQVTYRFLPGAPTFEGFDEPAESVTTLRKLSPEEAKGIESDRKLELWSADGELIPTSLFSIKHSDPSYRRKAEEACATAGVAMTEWEVIAHRDPIR